MKAFRRKKYLRKAERKKWNKGLDKSGKRGTIYIVVDAALAHPVERHLAKVEVASSSLVGRSTKNLCQAAEVF